MSNPPAEHPEVTRLKALMWKRSFFMMTRQVVDPSKLGAVALDHYRWMIAQEKAGKVFLSGPLLDKDGNKSAGVTIFRADSWEEAHALASADPFVTSGGVTYSLQVWQINEGRLSISVDFSDMTFQAD